MTRRGPTPDPLLGFYGPDSMMWKINREAVLLGAGPAALLLQVAHPLVAEGVAHHSDFAGDPFGRLRRTLITTMNLVFGDGPTAERAVRRLNGVHATVRGDVTTPEARAATNADAYRALDPGLLLWVQATLIVTSVRAYARWVGPLSDAELDRFWQEARTVGTRIGIPLDRSPADWQALEDYWETMLADDGPIHVTPTAQRLAPMILRPPLPLLPGWAVDVLALPGLGLLPGRIREGFGIAWPERRQRSAEAISRAVRLWTGIVPASARSMPRARRAWRRAAARAQGSARNLEASADQRAAPS
jgi:uncharacterized protein (DUF2236 family)